MLVNQSDFLQTLWDYYQTNGRHDLLWRESDVHGNFDPYRILVSEIMLQQTQVSRVTPKFNEFLINFPDVRSLAHATLADVLALWSGLGYNRRAKFLWQAAQYVTDQCNGVFPQTSAELQKLPGVGKNTAGAIMAYAFNLPVVFIETNIRTVYIHHFFADQGGVTDAAIYEVLEATVDQNNPREFYWALMDYGSHLFGISFLLVCTIPNYDSDQLTKMINKRRIIIIKEKNNNNNNISEVNK